MEALGNLRFVPRTEDALRNRKNLILTLNTLLRRKAYETASTRFISTPSPATLRA